VVHTEKVNCKVVTVGGGAWGYGSTILDIASRWR
jgi:hypothetical protein